MEVKLSNTLRDYVTVIHKLERRTEWAQTRQIAERLGVTDAAVTQAIGRLAQMQYVRHRKYRGVQLTAKGRRIAIEMIRHHRLLETFLFEVLKMPWDMIHDEAEKLQAYISPEFERRIDALLGHPKFDPHGTPIPGPDGVMEPVDYEPLLDVADVGERFVLQRVSDRDPKLLRYLEDLNLKLGTELEVIEIHPFDGPVIIMANGQRHVLSRELAKRVFVVPVSADDRAKTPQGGRT
ncbi:MAG: metal-dependent transcriptional regulator [Candidatus Zixiibacteriota bacterium]